MWERERPSGSSSSSSINSVFYAESYHPIQAGSIDGTDILPHDSGVYRAHLCASAGLYDPFGDPKVTGDPYCTLFVGRLSHLTTEATLLEAMGKHGRVQNLRLLRDIVTGASRGYAFVEYQTEREMRRAYEDAHHSRIDDSEIIVDYNRQQLMPGWIPRRLGGGLGGKKESGQLRFGGRERPFRAPLRPIPWDDLRRLGIPPPPEGRYMSRFQVPSPPRRKRSSVDREESSHKSHKQSKESYRHETRSTSRDRPSDGRSFMERIDNPHKSRKFSRSHRRERSSSWDCPSEERNSMERVDNPRKSRKISRNSHQREGPTSWDRPSDEKISMERKDSSDNSHKFSEHSHQRERSTSWVQGHDERSSMDREKHSRKGQKPKHSHRHERSPT